MSGNWGDPLLDFWQKNISYSYLICICIFSISWCTKCFQMMKDLNWRQVYSQPKTFYFEAMLLQKMQFYYYLTQICNTFPVKDIFWMGAYSHVKAVYTFQHWWCLFRCARWQFVGTNAAPYHQRCRLLNWMLIASWLVPLFFSLKDVPSRFSKNDV